MSENKPKVQQDRTFNKENELRLMKLELETAQHQETFKEIKACLIRLENKMDVGFQNVDNKFIEVNKRMDSGFHEFNKKMDVGFADINNRLWRNFYWMLGGFVSMLALLAHIQKWI